MNTQFFFSPSKRAAALSSGIALFVMALIAGYSFGLVFKELIVFDKPIVTQNNIQSSIFEYQLGIIGWILILICDIVTAWGLFHYLKSSNKVLSSVTALFRIIYALFLGLGIVCLTKVCFLLSESSESENMMRNILNFQTIWFFGLLAFSFHLMFLGVAVFKSKEGSKIWGFLLVLAGLSYLFSTSAKLLFELDESFEKSMDLILSIPMIIGELGFGIWLLFKGGK